MDYTSEKIIKGNWREILRHPTERHRPKYNKKRLTSAEIAYYAALNEKK